MIPITMKFLVRRHLRLNEWGIENKFSVDWACVMSYCYIEKLVDDIVGAYSRRINIQNQIANQVPEDPLLLKKLRMWIHYN